MLLAAPNLSEGRDPERIAGLAAGFGGGLEILDVHSDPVHNRSVFTLAGASGEIAAALLAGARAAVDIVDMSSHDGEHPCIGALDVCPVIWVSPPDRDDAIAEARQAATLIATELEIPVFLYGELATSEPRIERAYFRNGGLPRLSRRMASGDLKPDLGPAVPHATAGATLVTARPPLAAFNLQLQGTDLAGGREIAAGLRESGGGPPGVRAIAIDFGDGLVQISTNVHDPVAVPLVEVIAVTDRLARHRGAWVSGTELIGLVPEAAIKDYPSTLLPSGFDPERHSIEPRLAAFGG